LERTENELHITPCVRFDRFPKLEKGRIYQLEEASQSGLPATPAASFAGGGAPSGIWAAPTVKIA
jgi:hypothetical protein